MTNNNWIEINEKLNNTNNMNNEHKVVIGDGEYQEEEVLQLKKVYYGSEYRWFLGETEFDGHHVLWGFEYFPTTYLKSSSLSGNEYRKGGEIRYFRNRKQVFSEFCREPNIAALKIGATLLKLSEFHWDLVEIGRKVFYKETPCVIDGVIEDQGCVMLKTETGENFPQEAWEKDDEYEKENRIKVEVISPSLWWYRN